MRNLLAPALLPLLLLAACGGGSGSSGLGTGGGGGGGGGGGQTIAGPGPNVATMTVEVGPAGPVFANLAFVSVTICQPNSNDTGANCQTIDDVQVDTGSSGLRILSTASTATFLQSLPQQFAGGTSVPVVECAQFADGFSWGPVVSADVVISSEKASAIPIHVIGAPAPFNTDVPSSCSNGAMEEDTVATLGVNGIIGVGVFAQDCGSACAGAAVTGVYYSCPTNGSSCSPIAEPITSQVSNPVASFTTDNNGVILELPMAANGAASATGALVFGIGTESNNSLGSATVLTVEPSTGNSPGSFDVSFDSTDYPGSILDSGSSALLFTDSSLTPCAQGTAGQGFYCTAASNLTATLTGTNGTQTTATFSVGDATTMFGDSPNGAAFPQLAAPSNTNPDLAGVFDFGLPYFYSRNVFTAIEGMSAGGTQGPYYAY
jgi:hypothetical protein